MVPPFQLDVENDQLACALPISYVMLILYLSRGFFSAKRGVESNP